MVLSADDDSDRFGEGIVKPSYFRENSLKRAVYDDDDDDEVSVRVYAQPTPRKQEDRCP